MTITNGTPPTFATPHDRGTAIGKRIFDTIAEAQNNYARSRQSSKRVLGRSEMGGCREYIRATISGDEKRETGRLKWAAYIGTHLGDDIERDVKNMLGDQAVTQERVTVQVPIPSDAEGAEPTYVSVTGSLDLALLDIFGDGTDDLVDFKSKDGVKPVRADGPSFKECAQISGYLIACIEKGILRPNSMAHLVYIDRAGNDKQPWVYTITLEDARNFIAMVGTRLHEVASAMTAGITQSYLRDMPESWCYHTGCPFYWQCWDGYAPTQEITNVAAIAAMEQYDQGRELVKLGEQYKRQAKNFLNPDDDDIDHRIEGVGPTFTLRWTDRAYSWGVSPSIDLRRNR